MALGCRFCHPYPGLSISDGMSYSTCIAHGSIDGLLSEMLAIEALSEDFTGYVVHCGVCNRYSMLSYALKRFVREQWSTIDSYDSQYDAQAYYSMQCMLFYKMFPDKIPEKRMYPTTTDIFKELTNNESVSHGRSMPNALF